ncbi:alpha/beta hydrolase [Pelagibacterales bacterium SAG-MED28]|nr:alpha/beta hydrolase [Pelagibacterales bacterium SAG-MED28]
MKKFKYLKLTKTKKLRFIDNYFEKKLYVVFLHGFMSDIEGKKPQSLLRFAKRNKLGFVALEYSGHGKSSGDFTSGNISSWTNETKFIIEKIVKKNDFILIGSSMGSWIGLNQFKHFKRQIKGFIGIGSAPEFLTRLIWNKFTKKIKSELIMNGKTIIKSGNYEYPITYQLVKDGRKNKVLNKKINSKIKVTMIHGKKDEVVPVKFSKLVLSLFKNAKKKLKIISNGDHSLSSSRQLKIIIKELNYIIKDFI